MVAHRRLSDRGGGEFRQDAPIQTPRRVALLARGPPVLVQNFVDEGGHHAKLRPGPRRIAVRRGQRTGQRLAHHAAVDTELRGDPRDRADPELMLPTKLLEQIHFGFPVHARSPDSVGATVGLRDREGGPKSISTTGPKFDSRASDRRRELSSAATSPTAHSGRPYGDPRWPSVRIAAPHCGRARFRKPGQDASDTTGELRSSDWPALTHGVATDQVGYLACSTWSRKRM